MKIRKYGIGIVVAVLFALVIDYEFFYLFPYSGLMRILFRDSKHFLVGLLGVCLTLYILYGHSSLIVSYKKQMHQYTTFIIMMFVIVAFFTALTYPSQEIADILRTGGRFLYPIYAIPIIWIFERDGGTKNFLNIINCIAVGWWLLSIIQSICYSQTGTLLFSFMDYFGSDINVRNDNLRVGSLAFGSIMMLYNFIRFYTRQVKGWKRLAAFLEFAVGLYCVIVIQQTRVMTLICFICLALVLLIYGKTLQKRFTGFFIVLFIGVFLVSTSSISDFFSTFSSEDYEGSSIARDYALEYFWDVFLNNPLIGFGWNSNSSITHGLLGIAYTSDVGIVGMLAEIGLFTIPFYIVPIIRMVMIIKRYGLRKMIRDNPFLIILIVYLLGTTATLIITDRGRCFGFPLIIALFEYYYMHANDKRMVLKENM